MPRFVILHTLLLCFTASAHAAYVYSGLQHIAIPTGFNGVYIDIDNAAVSTTDFVGADINPFFGGSGFLNNAAFQPARTGTIFNDAIIRLAPGAVIDGSLNYASGIGISGDTNNHMGAGPNQFLPGTEGFLGFKFIKNDSTGPFYGWARLVFTNDTAGGLIEDWIYDDSGAAILAGVPEPGRCLLLLLGLMGTLTWRWRCHSVRCIAAVVR